MQSLASIPSPSQGIWHLGPIPLRAYAIMIILGIVAAVWLGERRWAAKGGTPGTIIDVAVWGVPFGLVGGRIYHVVTDYQRYFGEGGDPVRALEIWKGGLGIWGAVAFGALGVLIACRRRGISVLALGDAVAPGIALAQAIGRWGNYWNQELYGRPLDAFWALEIDEDHRPMLDGGPGLDPQYADIATYHPTFLYESLWCIGVAVLVIWADRRYKLTHGRAFALYVAAYTLGRAWIEALRIDEAHEILGLRLNGWTSILLFLGAVAYLYKMRDRTGPENVGATAADGPSGTAGPGEEKPEPKDGADTAEDAAPEPGAKDERPEAEDGPEPESEPETRADKAEDAEPEAGKADADETDASAEEAEATSEEKDAEAEPADKPAEETAEADKTETDDDTDAETETDADTDDTDDTDAKTDADTGDGVSESERVEKVEPVKDGKK
ncbi:prolipoprotein diacylglyceryl transferase [Actinomadura sp. 7K507]|uniref:prolipoprotein diacylglyceryl transferase n=1 Tax=Actinomadura sp. 7K507 TaxID=2530365 RepID=UPI0010522865|nr:prolipoprotein diacylglyceryl transferase [Actinomadura sp. 7K507]TDC82728.1 prolipoprotein diacylglyceryl transferase [Actinomadura sp. 7K507]